MLKNILSQIEAENEAEPLWIIGPEVGRFIHGLFRVIQPETVVEVGTSVGYSALWMASALRENGKGHVWTIESHKERFGRAQVNIREANMTDFITQLKGHAPEIFYEDTALPEHFDVIFLDATKKQHGDFYEAVLPRMKPGSWMLVDNVHSHRHVPELTAFVEVVHANPALATQELDLGTGLLLARWL